MEEVPCLDEYDYIYETMRLDLSHVVKLLQAKSSRALPFAQGIDPSVDLRWMFLGFDPVPGPRYLQTAGWEGCHYRARAQATRAVQQSADAPWGSQWGCRDRDNGAAVPCRAFVYLDGPIRYMTSPATVVRAQRAIEALKSVDLAGRSPNLQLACKAPRGARTGDVEAGRGEREPHGPILRDTSGNRCEACTEFLEQLCRERDDIGVTYVGVIHWGPLLGWAWLKRLSFNELGGYMAPDLQDGDWASIADNALSGIEAIGARLGVRFDIVCGPL